MKPNSLNLFMEDRLRFTAVYTERDGKWCAVAEQMTSFSAQ
jgi:hypothetical protein